MVRLIYYVFCVYIFFFHPSGFLVSFKRLNEILAYTTCLFRMEKETNFSLCKAISSYCQVQFLFFLCNMGCVLREGKNHKWKRTCQGNIWIIKFIVADCPLKKKKKNELRCTELVLNIVLFYYNTHSGYVHHHLQLGFSRTHQVYELFLNK